MPVFHASNRGECYNMPAIYDLRKVTGTIEKKSVSLKAFHVICEGQHSH